MSHTAELIAVGTELLLGNIANLDAQILSEGLTTLGINVRYHTVVGDNPQRLEEVLAVARRRADIIITTGGLGPTYDDLTKQTICRVFGRELELHPDILETIRDYFQTKLGREMPENNVQQAMLPVNCAVFDNPVGTAPGCAFCEGGVHVLMLPGPPFECRYLFEHRAVPYLAALTEGVIASHEIRIFGMGESAVEKALHGPMTAMTNPTLAPYAKLNECMVRATAKAESAQAAEAMLAPLVDQVRAALGDVVYGVDVDSLEQVVSGLLRERGLTLSAAESCTGGNIAHEITLVPGSSAYYKGSVVSYANEVKESLLGVSPRTIEQYGVVSRQVVEEMARGVQRLLHTDCAIATSGIAGPDGATPGKPVGTLALAVACGDKVVSTQITAGTQRERNIERFTHTALLHMVDLLHP